jgi:hypothetical protein
MARAAAAILAAALLAPPAAANPLSPCAIIGRIVEASRAQRKDECRPVGELAARLAGRYAEHPAAAMPYCDGRFALVLWAGDRTWTIVWRHAGGGSACIVSAGLRGSAGS